MADLCYEGQTGFQRASGDGYNLQKDGRLSGSLLYAGDKAGADAFLSGWPTGRSHPDNGYLRKTGHTVTYKGPMAVVKMSFEGADPTESGGVGGAGSKRKTEKIKRRATITKNETGISYFVDYLAPTATVVWTSGAEPSQAQKQATSGVSGKNIELETIVPLNPKDPFLTGDPNSAFTKGTDYNTTPLNIGFVTEPSGDDYIITEIWTLAVGNLA